MATGQAAADRNGADGELINRPSTSILWMGLLSANGENVWGAMEGDSGPLSGTIGGMSRTVMLLVAAANLLLGVCLYLVGNLGYGIAETVSFSRFHDLRVHHAIEINPNALKDISNAGLSDPEDVHPFLTEGFRGNVTVVNVAAIALVLNAATWSLAWWRSHRTAPAERQPPKLAA